MFAGVYVGTAASAVQSGEARLNQTYFFSAGLKSRAAEFMQYRKPVGAGPSSNTCPK